MRVESSAGTRAMESCWGQREVMQGLPRSVCVFKRPFWLQTIKECSLNKAHSSEPHFSALLACGGTIPAFEVIERIT